MLLIVSSNPAAAFIEEIPSGESLSVSQPGICNRRWWRHLAMHGIISAVYLFRCRNSRYMCMYIYIIQAACASYTSMQHYKYDLWRSLVKILWSEHHASLTKAFANYEILRPGDVLVSRSTQVQSSGVSIQEVQFNAFGRWGSANLEYLSVYLQAWWIGKLYLFALDFQTFSLWAGS